jgi:two-component system NtrC family response regulator
MTKTTLIADADAENRGLMCGALQTLAYRISEAEDAMEALDYLQTHEPDLVIADARLPGISGIELLRKVRGEHPATIVILLTAFATVPEAVETMRMGAHDYLTKPVDIDNLMPTVRRLLAHFQHPSDDGALKRRIGFDNILGRSRDLLAVLDQATRAARTTSTVLIQGETGTGKELLARGIHSHSPRSEKPFVTINCAAIPKDLLESELFGHVKGAFTGALMDRKGQIEAASGGTLFLDEIGEMPPELQVKLLRLLQGGEIQKVGAAGSTSVDVRVIAATHRDLFDMAQRGAFREDLYYRLNVIPLTLPSLRERREDIPELVEFFFDRSCRKHGRVHLKLPEFLMDRFIAYRWPGNVREMENVIERIVVLTPETEVGIDDLPPVLRPEPTLVEMIGLDLPPKGINLGGVERELLLQALEACDWNQATVARYLGLTRKTLIYRMHKYDLVQRPALRAMQDQSQVLAIA